MSNKYPAISHTFILREVVGLRALGMRIETISVNMPDRSFDKLTEEELAEARRTFYLKAPGANRGHALRLLRLAVTRPLVCLKALRAWLRYGGLDLELRTKTIFYLAESLLVGDRMDREGLEHIHGHFGGAVALVCMFAAEAFGKTFSFTIHGPAEYMDLRFYRIHQKASAAKFVVTISEFGRSHLLRLLGMDARHRVRAVHLGVDPDKFVPVNRTVEEGAAVHVVCVGRLVSEKAQNVLLEAFAKLVQRGVNARLTLVGDGEMADHCRQLCHDAGLDPYVTFAGALPQPQTLEVLHTADMFVLPSFAEGIPVALMEAMAMEIPCISTAITGIPELIRSGQDGVLVQAGDVEALAEAMHTLMENPALRHRLGMAGRVKVAEHFNLHRNVPKLHQVFVENLGAADEPGEAAGRQAAEKKVAIP